ncbi:Rqc2 family fibronectin-binding protein [Paradesulfitobacterium ferrireducens]|uniref:Rqc2 family fibronectin-binding protein n=1 Tax=Paradesulfitobacterium ferrireducens TaxID=2816476 RepID=UPI001A8E4864|nr:NFACT RNA binding domain-containing protein [Paradesulfitobacterium ferrireducens]
MALDGVTLYYLVRELAPQLIGTRVDKIHQPEKEEVHLLLRGQGSSYRLLLNASATAARFHITTVNKKNPVTPPMFCMILRKHLEGAKIIAVEQEGLERLITFVFQNYNERGDLATYHLHLEIMGKHSNLILVERVNIIDGLKRYSHALSRYREVLPGRPYLTPPSQGKLEPTSDEDTWRAALYGEDNREDESENLSSKLTGILLKRLAGVSPELARELVLQAGLVEDTRLEQCGDIDLSRLFQSYRRLACPQPESPIEPCLYYMTKQASAFTFLPFQQYQSLSRESFASLNACISRFYDLKSSGNTLEAKRGSLKKVVQEHQAHLSKKLNIYEETLAEARSSLAYQKWGELLTANLYRIQPGASETTVEDYYEANLPQLTIPLDPQLTPNENAQRYYRLYNKAKATLNKTEPLKESALAELRYLESLLVSLEQAASLPELEEIHTELAEQGYVAAKSGPGQRNKKSGKLPDPVPRSYYSSTERQILVGRNNKQNEWLTLKKAKPTDLWLHVKEIPGSHVIVPLADGEEFPDDATLEEAAALAIYFSQARGSSQVPVDYTHVKNIKKPKEGKPGMVIYDKNWTLYLTPKTEVVERLLESGE